MWRHGAANNKIIYDIITNYNNCWLRWSENAPIAVCVCTVDFGIPNLRPRTNGLNQFTATAFQMLSITKEIFLIPKYKDQKVIWAESGGT